jgi:hypothetical protein
MVWVVGALGPEAQQHDQEPRGALEEEVEG